MPMGVASMSLTLRDARRVDRRGRGRAGRRRAICASSAGTRLSSTRVVLPEPETPVTTVSRPLGMSTSSGFTVWMAAGGQANAARLRTVSSALGARPHAVSSPCRRETARSARRDCSQCAATVPCAITWPPPGARLPGPSPSIQSASLQSICVSWSTSTTELPSATRSCITPVRPTMLAGCRPMRRFVQHIQHAGGAVAHGAGQLHALPLAGGQRGGRAVERQIAQPQIHQPLGRALKGTRRCSRAMGRISSGRLSGTPRTQSTSCGQASCRRPRPAMMPRSSGARAAADRRVPPQSGQTSSFRNFSTRFMPFSSLTLARAFSTV